MAPKPHSNFKIAADNRKARFNYEIGEVFEAGIALTGTEVKSLRTGKATIGESYAHAKNGEIFLVNADIPEYLQANQFNHERRRPRKLLLRLREIVKLEEAVEREGMTRNRKAARLGPRKIPPDERARLNLFCRCRHAQAARIGPDRLLCGLEASL